MAEIVLRGDNICKMLIEVRIKNKDFLLPKNISILNFLLKCKVSYLYAFNQDLNDVINYTDMILIPSEEDYNNLIYKTLEKKKKKNSLIDDEDVLTITNISNTEEDFFYFKLKYE